MADIAVLKGLTLVSVNVDHGYDEITFHSSDGRSFRMYHYQDCCECVTIEDIVGDISDLVGHPSWKPKNPQMMTTPRLMVPMSPTPGPIIR